MIRDNRFMIRVEEAAPPPEEGMVERLRSAMFDAVSEADMTAIMEIQKKAALKGDMVAARFLINVLGLGAPKAIIRHEHVTKITDRDSPPVLRQIEDVDDE